MKELKNGQITIKDIARICGVGVSTVSRALNDHQDINPETKEMILSKIAEYGYVPNNSARNLKRTDAATIAILVKGITNPFFTDMIKIISEFAFEKNYSVELRDVEFNMDEIDTALELIKEKKLRGIIFLGGYFFHAEERLKKISVPFVMATAGCRPEKMKKESYSSYTVDDEQEGYLITKYLIDLGHRNIAILSGEGDNNSIGLLRLQGYKRALEEAGIEVKESLIRPMKEDIEYYTYENGYETMMDLIKSKEEVSAVFAISDVLAIGACRAIKDAGLSVPDDISVVGYDGIDMGKYVSPSITTIVQPVKEIARASVKHLFALIEDGAETQHGIFECKLEERESASVKRN